jgi:UDP-N-acetylmuramoylalanine--D-glutamate ligase
MGNKHYLIFGIARSGISLIKYLASKGFVVTATDKKDREELGEVYDILKGLPVCMVLGEHPDNIIDGVDVIIMSPGVPGDIPIINKAKGKGIEVISEIEFAYRYFRGNIVGITGTNGKTTTTSLTGEIFKRAGYKTFVAGNIGKPFIDCVEESTEKDVAVLEVSSFQLEEIKEFRPKVASVLNITPDHLNRHKTMENYILAKSKIFLNQKEEDTLILNYDCPITRDLAKKSKSNIIYFSRKEELIEGVIVKNNHIYVNNEVKIINIKDIYIKGGHNLENALAATAMAYAMDIDPVIISKTLEEFKGVEHRLEHFATVNGRIFINDSKGTNPDASIKAIEAMDKDVILIAGGMDKGNDFTEFIKAFDGKVKGLVLLGETAEIIKKTAMEFNFSNIYMVKTLEESVDKAYEISQRGDTILLSPACASWDMFTSFEERGSLFKEYTNNLLKNE